MKSIALFGSLIAVCGIGAMTPPASAKGGGAAAAGGIHGGMRAGGPAFFHKGHPTFVRGLAAKHAFRGFGLRRHANSILPPYWPGYGDFDPFYYYPPTDLAGAEGAVSSASEPVAQSQVPPNRVLVVTPGCRKQEQKVPTETGGERVINITRCY